MNTRFILGKALKLLMIAFIASLVCGCTVNSGVTNEIEKITEGKKLKLGVAVYECSSGET